MVSMFRSKSGFTLVELLVVITVIGLLMALLIPAVNMVRERMRQTTCKNNQRQLGQAILSYESNQQKLPGIMNEMTVSGGTVQYSWVEAVLPHLDRADLWDQLRANKAAALQTMRLAAAACPDDPYLADPTSPNAQALLSYGVNDQFFVDYRVKPYNTLSPPLSPPIGRSIIPAGPRLDTVAPAVLSNLRSRPNKNNRQFARGQSFTTTEVIMLGERTYLLPFAPWQTAYKNVSGIRAVKWADQPSPNDWASLSALQVWDALAFPSPLSSIWPPLAPGVAISPSIMASSHAPAGKSYGTMVVVTYFDGHCAILPSDTQLPYIPAYVPGP